MGKSNFFGKGKEKEPASSSAPQTGASKKRKTTGITIRDNPREDEEDEEYQAPRSSTVDVPFKTVWRTGPLFNQPQQHQVELFYEKMGDVRSIKDNMSFEKVVYRPDFRALGFAEKLRALGWEEVMDFRGNPEGYNIC